MVLYIRKRIVLYLKARLEKLLDTFSGEIRKIDEKEKKESVRKELEAEKAIEQILEIHKNNEAFQAKLDQNIQLWKMNLKKNLRATIGCCEKCGAVDRDLTLDHIIPQSFLKDLGIKPDADFNKNNFSLLCSLCNQQKGSRFDFTDRRTIHLLDYYLKDVPRQKDPFAPREIISKAELKKRRREAHERHLAKKAEKKKEKFSTEDTRQINLDKVLEGTPYDPKIM